MTAVAITWMLDALCAEPAYDEVSFFPELGKSSAPAKAGGNGPSGGRGES